jgi:Asp-tRNA(Asn)/Glu-tRNA(Gln) amidotransferase A subunit family amidase
MGEFRNTSRSDSSLGTLEATHGVGTPTDLERARDRLRSFSTVVTHAASRIYRPSVTTVGRACITPVAMARVRPNPRAEENAVSNSIARCGGNPFGAIAHRLPDRARATRGEDDSTSRGNGLALQGVPFVAKNSFDVAGLPTYAGGPFDSAIPPAEYDATAIARLTAEGATLVGTTHMDEYAFGFLGRNPHHGSVSNPRAPHCIAGGSSSGSSAAVAGGLVPLALGSDTNGSIRVPAALCGIYGFKPGFDCVSRSGMRPLAPSLDHVGLLAVDLNLLEVAYGALAGGMTAWLKPPERVSLGVAGGDFQIWCEPEIWQTIRKAIPLAAEAPRLELHGLEDEMAAASIITAVEAQQVHAVDLIRHPDRYSAEVTVKLTAAAEVAQRIYLSAKDGQVRARDKYLACFAKVDVLIVPTLPVLAPRVGNDTVALCGKSLPVSDAISLFTRPFSLAGLPAVTVPLTTTPHRGLAVQLICAPGSESHLWSAARLITSQAMASGFGAVASHADRKAWWSGFPSVRQT